MSTPVPVTESDISLPQSSRPEIERALNTPVVVQTVALGPVTLRDIPFEALLTNVAEILSLLAIYQRTATGVDQAMTVVSLAAAIAKDPKFHTSLRKILSCSASRPEEDFKGLGTKDALSLIIALKDVLDFESIKDLFFQMTPKNPAGL
jgi:hypothetical protein